MKGKYVIAIAFLASWAVSTVNSVEPYPEIWPIPTVCPFPEHNPHNTTTHLAHEWDCTRYYKCFLGRGVEQLCPLMIEGDPVTRLHFNRLHQVCDWPWQAGCSSCPEHIRDGRYPPKISGRDNCREYYECINGQMILRYCPAYTCFSRTCQECVSYREGGNCPGGPGPTPTPTPTPGPGPTCPGGNPNGDTKGHECDCAKYYTCRAPDWILDGQCQGGLHFSPTRKICLPPNEANCPVR